MAGEESGELQDAHTQVTVLVLKMYLQGSITMIIVIVITRLLPPPITTFCRELRALVGRVRVAAVFAALPDDDRQHLPWRDGEQALDEAAAAATGVPGVVRGVLVQHAGEVLVCVIRAVARRLSGDFQASGPAGAPKLHVEQRPHKVRKIAECAPFGSPL